MSQAVIIDLNTPAPPSVSELLAQRGFPESIGGSTRGWSAMSLAPKCWRLAFYTLVKGYQPLRPSDALDKGTLFHSCMECHFRSGGQETEKPLQVVEADMPELVAKVRRLIRARMQMWGAEEARTHDIRALEYEVVCRIEGKATMGAYAGHYVVAPVSSKFDLVFGRRAPDAPLAPPGPLPDGVSILDYKTTSRATRDKTAGYGMDAQLLLMAYNWRAGGLDQVFGPLRSIIIELIVDTKELPLRHLEIMVEDADVERFMRFLIPWAVNLESMLALAEGERDDEENWPMNYAGCHTAYGLCKFWDLCETRGRATSLYAVHPDFRPCRGLLPNQNIWNLKGTL